MSELVSIMLPTMNRPDFLHRALCYYRNVGFRGWIIIADSSDERNVAANLRNVESMGKKLQIIYRYYPNPPYTIGECLNKITDLVPTPYAVSSGDDDFIIPLGINMCVRFLENNPEFIAAFGQRANAKIVGDGVHGKVESAFAIPQPEAISDSATERWITYLQNGRATLFYVTRIEIMRRIYRHSNQPLTPYMVDEFMPCSLMTILGKSKRLDCMTVVFQAKSENALWKKHSLWSLMNAPEWAPSMEVIRANITSALIERGVERNQAEVIFERETWRHTLQILISQFQQKYGNLVKRANGPGDLPVLLDPSGPFHKYFEPVYQALRSHPRTKQAK